MSDYVVRILKPSGEPEYFRASYPGERFSATVNDRGDITITRWNQGDPETIHHTVAILSVGTWTRIDEGYTNEESFGPESSRCSHYWNEHKNRCIRKRDHKGDHFYCAPDKAISVDIDFKLPEDI
jgi:hypothetical protein